MMCCPLTRLCGLVKLIVSNSISTPPPRARARLSNSISRNLSPRTGSNSQPDPLPPVSETPSIDSISKSCGSTNTCFTSPITTASTKAVVFAIPIVCPTPKNGSLIVICGGLITS